MQRTKKGGEVVRRLVLGFLLSASCLLAGVGAVAAESSAKPASPVSAASTPARKSGPTIPDKLVNINDASRAELKTLPGIGDAEAEKIVAGRPYLSKADLVTKNVLPTGVYLSLRRGIYAGASPSRPAASKGQT